MSTKLQSLLTCWKNFDLASVQLNLDEVAAHITSRQDESEASRKQLIGQVRDFKKASSEETRSHVAPLVRSFQNEIDALSKRSQAAEKAFFEIYRQLVDLADPVPVLEQTVDKIQKQASKLQDLDVEMRQVREANERNSGLLQELKSKDKKLHELQAKVAQYDRNIDETLKEKLSEAVVQIQADFDSKLRTVSEERDMISSQMADKETKLKSCQRQLETTQQELFDLTAKASDKAEARSVEMDLLISDLDAVHQRALLAEREAEALREKVQGLEAAARSTHAVGGAAEGQWQGQLDELQCHLSLSQRELGQVRQELQQLRTESAQRQSEWAKSVGELEQEKLDLAGKVLNLTLQLDSMADYSTIKKDLATLKAVEFSSSVSGDDDQLEVDKPLEVLILERSRILQADNSSLRLERDRLLEDLGKMSKEHAEQLATTQRQAGLIAELEEHVEKLQEMPNANRGEAEGRSSTTDFLAELDLSSSGRFSPDTPHCPSSPVSEGSRSSLLPIVQAQRERLRRRNQELEEQGSQLSLQVTSLQHQLQDLQTDNLKLYEKIRFLQGVQAPRKESVSVPVESKYQRQYENRLDPFAAFSNQERQRKYSQLNIVEKIILSMVHFMMANKVARLFVFIYSLVLHALVFVVLMNQAVHESNRRELAAAGEWQQRYLDHMEQQHAAELPAPLPS